MIKITDSEFMWLYKYIKSNYGIDLEKKKHLIEGRLGNVLEARGIKSFSEYFEILEKDADRKEISLLISKLTTNHTFFMREQAHFDYYRNVVLPELYRTVKNNSIGVWSAGCSSGEEPYTLAMLNDDFFSQHGKTWDTRVLATDISDRVLELARNGIYNKASVKSMPGAFVKKYFSPYDDESMIVKDSIKKEVIYKRFNLMDNITFKRKFNVIFCRNVMIYFDKETKLELVKRFYDATEHGGYLFIGLSEYLDKNLVPYEYVRPAVYRKG